jgi:predicted nucleotide-binding protein (sugar kinase/HSP70/actin superfamily)
MSLGHHCGEGWFLTAEMIDLIENGVPNIVCVQPFGCLPNHVTGKGMIKELKRNYPQANITAIDYDPGASEVNQLNRLKLMLTVALKDIAGISESQYTSIPLDIFHSGRIKPKNKDCKTACIFILLTFLDSLMLSSNC